MKKRKAHKPQPKQPPAAAKAQSVPGEVSVAASSATAAVSAAPSAIREIGHEPVAKRAAVPAMAFAVLAAILFWGDMHIVGQSGEFDPRVHYPFESVKQIGSLRIEVAEPPLIRKGREVYGLVCKSCHEESGAGRAGEGIPPLCGSDWVNVRDPARLIRIVLYGLSGPVDVNGKTYSGKDMLAWGSMSDEELAAALSFVRNTWGNKNPLVTPEEIKKVRDEVGARGYFTQAELHQIPLKP